MHSEDTAAMIVIGTREHGARRRRPIPVDADTFHKSEWLEGGSDPLLSPTAFLVEQPPDTTLVPHFHRQNQFQLFVAGGGTIGREPLGPVTVHYAGAYTGYGPLISGPQGIQYFTIRPVLESGFTPVQGGRDKMVRGPKRHAQSRPVAPPTAEALRALAAPATETLIAPAPDGLASFATLLPPGSAFAQAHVPASQGCFVFVLAGEVRLGARTLGPWEHFFVSSDEIPPSVTAGADGAQVVSLHTPPREAVYQEAERAAAAQAGGRA